MALILIMQCAILALLFIRRRPPAVSEPPPPTSDTAAAAVLSPAHDKTDNGAAALPPYTTDADRLRAEMLARHRTWLLDPFDFDFDVHTGLAAPDTLPPYAREVNRMMDRAMQDLRAMEDVFAFDDDGWGSLMLSPALDMRDQDDHYLVVCSLPGDEAGTVNVTLEGRLLTIVTDTASSSRHQSAARHYERRMLLPGPVAPEHDATACLTNGVLRIVIPKALEMASAGTPTRLM